MIWFPCIQRACTKLMVLSSLSTETTCNSCLCGATALLVSLILKLIPHNTKSINCWTVVKFKRTIWNRRWNITIYHPENWLLYLEWGRYRPGCYHGYAAEKLKKSSINLWNIFEVLTVVTTKNDVVWLLYEPTFRRNVRLAKATRPKVSEDGILHSHRHECLKSYTRL
jgi:hypothetical protein